MRLSRNLAFSLLASVALARAIPGKVPLLLPHPDDSPAPVSKPNDDNSTPGIVENQDAPGPHPQTGPKPQNDDEDVRPGSSDDTDPNAVIDSDELFSTDTGPNKPAPKQDSSDDPLGIFDDPTAPATKPKDDSDETKAPNCKRAGGRCDEIEKADKSVDPPETDYKPPNKEETKEILDLTEKFVPGSVLAPENLKLFAKLEKFVVQWPEKDPMFYIAGDGGAASKKQRVLNGKTHVGSTFGGYGKRIFNKEFEPFKSMDGNKELVDQWFKATSAFFARIAGQPKGHIPGVRTKSSDGEPKKIQKPVDVYLFYHDEQGIPWNKATGSGGAQTIFTSTEAPELKKNPAIGNIRLVEAEAIDNFEPGTAPAIDMMMNDGDFDKALHNFPDSSDTSKLPSKVIMSGGWTASH